MAKIPANILKMALDAIDEPVAAVGRAVSDMPETAARALDDMAGTVDDWGWKGGKPGEITGGQYMDLYEDARKKAYEMIAPKQYLSFEDRRDEYDRAINEIMSPTNHLVMKQLSSNPRTANIAKNRFDILDVMNDFSYLEKADIPRELTGKLLPTLYDMSPRMFGRMLRNVGVLQNISRELSKLEPLQRETFVSLLPEWEGSLESLAVVARSVT